MRARRALQVKGINIIKIVSITIWASDEKKRIGRMQKAKVRKELGEAPESKNLWPGCPRLRLAVTDTHYFWGIGGNRAIT